MWAERFSYTTEIPVSKGVGEGYNVPPKGKKASTQRNNHIVRRNSQREAFVWRNGTNLDFGVSALPGQSKVRLDKDGLRSAGRCWVKTN